MESIEPGAYYDITNEQYHQGPGVSSSQLKAVLDCPSKWKHEYIDGNRPEPTRDLIIGTAVHTKVLEPDMFYRELENKVVRDNLELINGMAEAVLNHPVIGKIFNTTNGAAELSVYDVDEETGELIKTRPDWYRSDVPHHVYDLKTARSASFDDFQRAIGQFRYHLSAAMCLDIMERHFPGSKRYIFIVVEKKPPFPVVQYWLDDKSLQQGMYEYREALYTVAECRRTGIYPHYNMGRTTEIGLANWYYRKMETDFLF